MILFTFKVDQAESGMVSGQISEAQLRLGIKIPLFWDRQGQQSNDKEKLSKDVCGHKVMIALIQVISFQLVPSVYKCDTCKLDNNKFTMLNRPSPKIRPLANTIIGNSCLFNHDCQYILIKPPIVRASVKDGVLYIPTIIISNIYHHSR